MITLKTLSFTAMHFAIAFSVVWALTGSWAIGGLVAMVEPLCNSVGYFVHEKVWARMMGEAGGPVLNA